MKPQLDRSERETIRLEFFRQFRGAGGCSSVAVRRDKMTGAQYFSVGVVGDASRVPPEYGGLRVQTYAAAPATYAVQYAA
jgi:hypothetical protein